MSSARLALEEKTINFGADRPLTAQTVGGIQRCCLTLSTYMSHDSRYKPSGSRFLWCWAEALHTSIFCPCQPESDIARR